LFSREKESASIVYRFIGLFRRKKPSLKENVSVAVYLLDSTSNKLKFLSEGMKKRDQKFFMKCIEAQINNDHSRAIMYSNECAEVRKLARLVISSELVLEQAALRLQTLNKLGDVLTTIVPIVEIVEETKGRLVGVVPSVSDKLTEINSVLKNSLSEMGSTADTFEDPSNNSSETMKILEEANLTAEEKIREKFPKLPEEFEISEKLKFRIPVALTATGGNSDTEFKDSLKQQVYEYIKICNGQISLTQCASSLGVPLKNIEEALLRLKEENRIVNG
jgi:division protein CdvB (Snf7/Vps24/ESCRT-III family)